MERRRNRGRDGGPGPYGSGVLWNKAKSAEQEARAERMELEPTRAEQTDLEPTRVEQMGPEPTRAEQA